MYYAAAFMALHYAATRVGAKDKPEPVSDWIEGECHEVKETKLIEPDTTRFPEPGWTETTTPGVIYIDDLPKMK